MTEVIIEKHVRTENGAIICENDEVFMVIKENSKMRFGAVTLDKILDKTHLRIIYDGNTVTVIDPSQIVEATDTLRRISVFNALTDAQLDEIKAGNTVIL